MKRHRVGLVCLVMVCICLISGCNRHERRYQGFVEGDNLYISGPFGGVLKALPVHAGQLIAQGDLIARLDAAPQKYTVQQAMASLRRAKHQLQDMKNPKRPEEIAVIEAQIKQADAQLRLAKLRVHRYEVLVSKNALDKDSLDNSKERAEEFFQLQRQQVSRLALAEQGARGEQIKAQLAQVKRACSALKAARWELEQKQFYAPTSGVVFDTYYKPGEYVPPGRPVASILAPENIRIDFFVPVKKVDALHLGQVIYFTSYDSDRPKKATITYISPEAEYVPPLVYSRENYTKLVFRIKATAEDTEHIKSGQPVLVTVSDDV